MLQLDFICLFTAASAGGGGGGIVDLPIKRFGTSPCQPIQAPTNTRLTIADWTENTSKMMI